MIIITNEIYKYNHNFEHNIKTAGTGALNAFRRLFLFLNFKLNV